MWFGVILVVIIVVMAFDGAMKNVQHARETAKNIVCPPHKWRHREIEDANGNAVGWTLVCDYCGPLIKGSDEN